MSSVDAPGVEDLLRELAPRVLGVLVRRYGRFDSSEDAVQEALLAAATQWPEQGVPESPRAWLVTVASRRLVDGWRSEDARRRREEQGTVLDVPHPGPVSLASETRRRICMPSMRKTTFSRMNWIVVQLIRSLTRDDAFCTIGDL